MRRITSLTAGLSFLLVILTSVVLYIVPQGRVAYWAEWRLWGLSKTDWGNIHINIGLLFLVALFLHIYYNWKPLTAYLRNRTRQFTLFNRDFNAALIVTVACTLGSYFLVPPFNWVMALNDHFKAAGAARYGEPPYGHAELSSLASFAQKMNLDIGRSMALLRQAGIPAETSDQSLAAIARRHAVTPQRIYQVIQAAERRPQAEAERSGRFPASPPSGSGNLALADFCRMYNLSPEQVIRTLAQRGVTAKADETLKQIAAAHRMSPLDLYDLIKAIP